MFLLINSVFLSGWVLLLAMTLVFPCQKIYLHFKEKKPLYKLYNTHLFLSLLTVVVMTGKVAFFTSLRFSKVTSDMTNEDLQRVVSGTIYLELVYGVPSFVGVFIYSEMIVRNFNGVNQDKWSTIIARPFHVLYFTLFCVFTVCFATLGVHNSLEDYVFWRRMVYLTPALSEMILEPLLIGFTGYVAIQKLLKKDKDNEESKIGSIKKKILRIKATIKGRFLNALLLGAVHLCVVVLNETLVGNYTGLLVSKIVVYTVQLLGTVPVVTAYFIPAIYKLLGHNRRNFGLSGTSSSDQRGSKKQSADLKLSPNSHGNLQMLNMPIKTEVAVDKTIPGATQAESANQRRFEIELEFVQLLCNPQYLLFLGQERILNDECFINYLDYLLYWKRKEYRAYIVYPYALTMLECLQHAEFRHAFLSADSCLWLHQRQYRHWEMFRKEHVGILDELLEYKEIADQMEASARRVGNGDVTME
ncbi:suppressor of hpr1 [Kappamyces sp. JEL0829]|nr:suppressor of hpr1 [Kappamyces sp. JEL0829]